MFMCLCVGVCANGRGVAGGEAEIRCHLRQSDAGGWHAHRRQGQTSAAELQAPCRCARQGKAQYPESSGGVFVLVGATQS